MNITTDNVTVLGTGQWNDDDPKFGEYLAFRDGAGKVRKWTNKLNGSTPAEGEIVRLKAEVRQREDAKLGADGKPYIGRRDQYRVTEALKAA